MCLSPLQKRGDGGNTLSSIPFDSSNAIKTFGAVPVTPTDFLRLLQASDYDAIEP